MGLEACDPKRNDYDEAVGPSEASQLKALAARVMCTALDRVDVQYAAKALCHEMFAPGQSA